MVIVVNFVILVVILIWMLYFFFEMKYQKDTQKQVLAMKAAQLSINCFAINWFILVTFIILITLLMRRCILLAEAITPGIMLTVIFSQVICQTLYKNSKVLDS